MLQTKKLNKEDNGKRKYICASKEARRVQRKNSATAGNESAFFQLLYAF